MVRVYKIKNFDIYSNKNGAFIVYNTNKSFEQGHTHINNYNTAKYIANLAVHQSLPKKNISKYLIQSLIRISSDKNYIKKLNMMRN